jgi:hypothetical protein
MGVHGRLFRNVASNLGNEILDNFEAEVQRDYIATKKLAADETRVFNGQLNNLDAAYENFGQMKNYMINNPNLFSSLPMCSSKFSQCTLTISSSLF